MTKDRNIDSQTVEAVASLGSLILKFGQTYRATTYPDGSTPESDTDHTLMLAVIACAFAKEFAPKLNVGKIAQICLVHDLVEVYAGDTPTLVISKEDIASKGERELAAFERIKAEFGSTLPWVSETIEEYESLGSPEARYVKTMDKLMPQMTHLLNDSKLLRDHNFTRESLREYYKEQASVMNQTFAAEHKEVMQLRDALNSLILDAY